jgi:DnaJ-class molecular chaperone
MVHGETQTTAAKSKSAWKLPACASCGGTGEQWLMNSWFPEDGYRRARCGICTGAGKSDYRDDAEFCRRQAERRAGLRGCNATS